MFKNVSGQKITLLAIDTATNLPKTGDAANLTAYVSKDDGTVTALTDTSATEKDATNAPGLYDFDVTQAESNANKLVFSGKSSTSGVRIVPVTIYTRPANFSTLIIDSGGRPEVNVSHWANASVSQSLGFPAVTVAVMNEDAAADIDIDGKIRAALGMSSANLDTQLGTIDSNVDSILEDTGTTLPGTLSSISSAVGTVDSVVDAIKVTTDKLDDTLEDQGSGTYGFTEAALQEAPTGAGSGATAQEVWEYATRTLTTIDEDSTTLDLDATIRAAVGMSSANLDTQIAALPTAAENADAVWEEALADHEETAGSTAEALAQAGGSGASAADIADAVLDEAMSGHTTAGTLGKAIADILEDTGTTLPSAIAAVEADTQDLQTQIGTNGAGLTAIPWNAAWDAEVQSECADALTAYDPPTNAEMEARTLAAANYATASALATVDSNVDAILVDTDTTIPGLIGVVDGVVDAIKAVTDNLPDSGALTSLATASALSTVDGVVDAIKTVTDKLDDTLEDQGSGTYGFTEAALQEAPTGAGSGATAQEVWEYATRTLTTIDEDSTTLDLDATIRAAVGMSAANLDTQLGTIDSNVDSILDDTGTSGVVVASIANGAITANAIASNAITADKVASDAVSEIQSGLATASALATVDSVVDAIKVTTDKLDDTLEDDGGTYRFTQNALEQAPSGGEGGTSDWTADEKTAIRAILGIPSSGTTPDDPSSGILDTIRDAIGVVDGNVDAILEDTGTTIPSTLSSITSAISTIDGIVDEILVDTGTTLPGTLSTIAGYIDTEIASLISAVGTVDGVVDAIKAVTDNLPDSGALTSLATASALATVDANVDAILEDTGTTIPSTLSSLLTTALTESYRGVGQTGSVAQLLYEIIAHMGNSSVSSTTKTLKKLDRSTTAKTYTLDDADAPTSIEEAS